MVGGSVMRFPLGRFECGFQFEGVGLERAHLGLQEHGLAFGGAVERDESQEPGAPRGQWIGR